jgi:hypothetical protein
MDESETLDRLKRAIIDFIFEAVRIRIEKTPTLKLQPFGDVGLALCNTELSITVTARMASDGQRIMLEYQRPDETTGVLLKQPDTVEIKLAEKERPIFQHKGAQLDFSGVAELLIKAAEGSAL